MHEEFKPRVGLVALASKTAHTSVVVTLTLGTECRRQVLSRKLVAPGVAALHRQNCSVLVLRGPMVRVMGELTVTQPLIGFHRRTCILIWIVYIGLEPGSSRVHTDGGSNTILVGLRVSGRRRHPCTS